MTATRACYSIPALRECARRIKAINWTVKHKNEHFAKCNEIEEVYQFAADYINSFLFDPDYELKHYRNMAYNFKNYTGKELNSALNQARLYICREITGIMTMISNGEVDSNNDKNF